MSPQYFAHTLTLYEAEHFVKGFRRKEQTMWELARYMAFYSAAPHCKDFPFERMGKFPWEREAEEENTPELSEEEKREEIERAREYARKRDEELIKKIENGIR